jgi:hypothetical protein
LQQFQLQKTSYAFSMWGPCLWEFYHRRHSRQFQWYCTFQITTVQENILGSFKIPLVFTRNLVTEDILCIFDVGVPTYHSSKSQKTIKAVSVILHIPNYYCKCSTVIQGIVALIWKVTEHFSMICYSNHCLHVSC